MLSLLFLAASIALTVKQTGSTTVLHWRTSLFTRMDPQDRKKQPGFAATTSSTHMAVNWGQTSFLHRSCRRLQDYKMSPKKRKHLHLITRTEVRNLSKLTQTLRMWDMSVLFTLVEPSVHNTWGYGIPVLPWQCMWCHVMFACSKQLLKRNRHETSHLAAIRCTEWASSKGKSCGTILLLYVRTEPPNSAAS